MALRDFALLVMVCLLWASNNIVSKYVVSDLGAPPLLYAGFRFVVVTLAALPWLRPMPRPAWRLIAVALFMGAGNFSLVFLGLQYVTASTVAVVSQVSVPVAALLGVLVLKERIGVQRATGIMLALAGVVVVLWRPDQFQANLGLAYIVGAALAGAFGTVMMKQMPGIAPLRFQAWVGFVAIGPMFILSAIFEPGAWGVARQAGWPLAAASLYSGLAVSVIGHTGYFFLVQKYEANLIAPLTLMTPLATVVMGVALMRDPIDLQMALGGVGVLVGVLVMTVRTNRVMLLLARLRSRP